MNDIFVEKKTLSVDTKILSVSEHYFLPQSVESRNFAHLSLDDKPHPPSVFDCHRFFSDPFQMFERNENKRKNRHKCS